MELQKTSASGVKTFESKEGCPRRWYIENVLGERAPQTAAQADGELLHSDQEKYLKTGEPPNGKLAKLAKLGLQHLPKPDPRLLVEDWMSQPTMLVRGVRWVGRIDWIEPPTLVPNRLLVGDHKTTKDFGWSKTREELLDDVQMRSYGLWGVLRFFPQTIRVVGTYDHFDKKLNKTIKVDLVEPNIDELMKLTDLKVFFKHVNYRTRGGAEAKPVEVETNVDNLRRFWFEIGDVVERMKCCARGSLAEAKQNTNACGAYGGCPHREKYCNLSDREVMKMALGAIFKKQAEEKAKAAAAAAAAETKKVDEKPAEKPVEKPVENPANGVVPPDAPENLKPGATAEEVPSRHAGTLNEGKVETPPAAEAPKRGRPIGSKNKKKDEACAGGACPVTPANEEASEPEDALDLFIDCLPVKGITPVGRVKMLEDLVAERMSETAEQEKVTDLRLIEFAKGKGYFANNLRKNPPLGVYVCRRGSDYGDIAIDTLIPFARTVVQGSK